MITEYILQNLAKAHYKILDDGTYYGEITGLQGVWADGKTLESCRKTLKEVLEDWLVLKLRDGDPIPNFQINARYKVGAKKPEYA